MIKIDKLKNYLNKHGPTLLLVVIIVVFISFSSFLALNLKEKIIPDEKAHLIFSKHFSTTWKIPPDIKETYSWGWYIEQNPFLYHWINGRIINAIDLFQPTATNSQIIVTLRLVNVFYALGTVMCCYLLSRELIHDRWWQLLPVFLLTNTLMFVFLSGGVNYDNLANLFSMASLYFLIRAFKRYHFLTNSLIWMIFIALGALVKYTILPLALAMALSWIIYLVLQRKSIDLSGFTKIKTIILILILLSLLTLNILIYGVNLIRYQSLKPTCRDILSESQCEISPYERRDKQIANQTKLSIEESIAQGYPSPIRYAFVDWVYHMLLRNFGMVGHESYFPLQFITLYQILFYSMLGLSLFNLLYWRRLSYSSLSLLFIALFYALILLIQNYNSELVYNFTHIAFQGRYIFPVIGAIYVLFTKSIKSIPFWVIQKFLLISTLILYFVGGPITIMRGYHSFLSGWFS